MWSVVVVVRAGLQEVLEQVLQHRGFIFITDCRKVTGNDNVSAHVSVCQQKISWTSAQKTLAESNH